MLRFRHRTLIALCGVVWLAIGGNLLSLGLRLLAQSREGLTQPLPLLNFLHPFCGGYENGAVLLMACGLGIGVCKGRFIFSKSVEQVVGRLSQFPEPTPLFRVYSLPYYLLIGGMILLGVSMRYLGVPYDVRGLVDTAVGAALINGALLYFRRLGIVKK